MVSGYPVDFTLEAQLPSMRSWAVRGLEHKMMSHPDVRPLWADASSSLSILVTLERGTALTYIVDFADIARFEIRFETREVIVEPTGDKIAPNTLHHLLVDQVWPRIIAQGGQLVVHAAGVSTSKGAILLLGPSGRGKSTLAASLARRGFPLLGDDAIVVSDQDCRAVYPSLRLFPDSIDTLFHDEIAHSAVAHYGDKRNVHLGPDVINDQQHQVRAIFFLNEDGSGSLACAGVVSPSDACMRLVEHSFWLDPTDMALTKAKLRQASKLAERVPMWQLDYPRDFSKLDDLHAAIFSVLA